MIWSWTLSLVDSWTEMLVTVGGI